MGYTRGHLHNRVKGHKHQSLPFTKHFKTVHGATPQDLLKRFEGHKNKFDSFIVVHVMLFIRALKRNHNVQSSIRATVIS